MKRRGRAPDRRSHASRLALARSAAYLLLAGHAAAAAQVQSLDPIVVTGSRSEIASFDLPMSVDSIDSLTVHDGQLGINVSEVLQRVPGLVIQNRQNYAQDLQISSRGFGARSPFGVRGIKLIADGVPASTPDGQGQAATFNLDVADRFEVLRGPMATIYGGNAGGVIQMFSRDGQGEPRVSAQTLAGSNGLIKNRIGAEGVAGGVGFVIDASRLDTDGYREHSAARRDQTFAKITTHPDENSKLSVINNGFEQNLADDPLGLTWRQARDDPRSAAAQAVIFDTRKRISNHQGGLNYETRIGTGTLNVNAYAGTRQVIQYLAIPPAAQASPLSAGGVVDFTRVFQGAGLRWTQPLTGLPGAFEWITGLDLDRSRDHRKGYENFIGTQLGVKGAERRSEIDTASSLAPYMQANWVLGDWTLQAALRYNTVQVEVDDRYPANGDDSGKRDYRRTTPALGALYAITPDLHVYASASTAFETPTMGELAYSNAGAGFNGTLEPSHSRQVEIGAKARLGPSTRVNLALFDIRTENEVVVQESLGGRTTYRNAGKTRRKGVELGVQSDLTRHVSATLSVSQLSARSASTTEEDGQTIGRGAHLPGVPDTTIFGELVWRPRDWVSTAIEALYRGKVYVDDANQARPAPAYAVFNWRAQFEQRAGPWTFTQLLRLENLFGKRYIGSVIVDEANARYYEPVLGLNWYAGASIQYTF